MRRKRFGFNSLIPPPSGIVPDILLVLALTTTGMRVTHADELAIHFDIAEQPIDTALLKFAQQAQVPILFPSGSFKGIRANRLIGDYAIEDALELLLEGTRIKASIASETKQLVIRAMDETEAPAVSAPAEQAAAPGEGKSISQKLLAAISSLVSGNSDSAANNQRTNDITLEEITITGSRIRQTSGMTTPVPITSVTTDELRSFEPAGTISEQLDNLPQFFQTQTAQRGGGSLFGDASGSYLNLRGMGKQRTLVLFDGSRTVPADRASTVNIDNFSTALIRSVDVVTGGASAAYGADAIAGVVNFVLDREFEGFKINTSTGVTGKGDGANWNFSIAGGRQFGQRFNVISSLEARYIDEIYRDNDALDNYQQWGWVTNPAWQPGAAPGIPQRITLPDVHSTQYNSSGIINQKGFVFDRFTFTSDGTGVRKFVTSPISSFGGPGATNTQSGGPEAQLAFDSFDAGVRTNAVNQSSGFLGFKYALTDNLDFFGQGLAGRTEAFSTGRRGNPHMQTDTWHATIFADNAFLPEVVRQAMMDAGLDSIRMDKLGQLRGPTHLNWYDDRGSEDVSIVRSGTVGLDWTLHNGWELRASTQRGLSKVTTVAYNVQRNDRVFLALDAVRDPQTGAIVCHSTLVNPSLAQLQEAMLTRPVPTTTPPSLTMIAESPVGPDDPIHNCVPMNVFGNGNVSQAAADWVVEDKNGNRRLDQNFAELVLNGELFAGFGAGPVTFATGFTYRDESFYQFAFEAGQPVPRERGMINLPELGVRGIPVGFAGGGALELTQFTGTSQATGGFDVWEWFSEMNLPVWESATGNQQLVNNVAYRTSDYSSSGRVVSWKLGLDLQIRQDLRLRLTRSRDVREPTLGEQFQIGGGGAQVNDPVFGGVSRATTSLLGNNPNLAPEKANTLTAGIVYQPDWLEGLQLAIDWYEIALTSAVGQLGPQRILDECYTNKTPMLCALIMRDPVTNELQVVNNQFLNISSAKTAGADYEIQYYLEPDFITGQSEFFTFRLLAGHLLENSDTPAQGNKLDQVGSINRPEWTASLSGSYQIGPMGIRLQQTYYDSTLINISWQEGVHIDDNTIASESITNMAFFYNAENRAGNTWGLTFSVNNLLDREPPVIPSISSRGASQTVSTNFDMLGRRFQLSFNMGF